MSSLVQLPRQARKLRSPQHRWHVRQVPFAIQPIFIAPVLPGETLKSAVFQARVVTDPIVNPLIGWWQEYYFFYVSHRNLEVQALLDMMINPDIDLSAYADTTVDFNYYHRGVGINWLKRCTEKIVDHYFRDEGDAASKYMINGLYGAKVQQESVFDSIATAAEEAAGDLNVDLNADSTIKASEVEIALRTWKFLRDQNLTEMTYEDYLRTYGVKVAREASNIPELIRYVREWTYPANTVDATGAMTSVCSWGISERLDKDRFFKEPGFIVGYSLTRPKVYLGMQSAAGASLLQNAYSWLPAIMRDDPATSLRQIATAAGSIMSSGPDGFWIDVRDLFMYGDQFLNFSPTATDANCVALPTANLSNLRYPTKAMVDTLFKVAANDLVRQDGVISLNILGNQTDTTPRGSTLGFTM